MLVKDFITKRIPVLRSYDTVEYALSLMDDLKLRHLPLLDEHVYVCLVSEKDLLAMPDSSVVIGKPVLFAPSVSEEGNLHDALAMITRYGLSLLPVVSTDGVYLGSVTRERLVDVLSELCAADAEGSVIVLSMMPADYSLTDLARLVEANHAHVLNLLSYQDKATGRLYLTLKIDLEDASPVIRSLERFDYEVLYHFMKKGLVDDMLRQRMNEVLYYMSM